MGEAKQAMLDFITNPAEPRESRSTKSLVPIYFFDLVPFTEKKILNQFLACKF